MSKLQLYTDILHFQETTCFLVISTNEGTKLRSMLFFRFNVIVLSCHIGSVVGNVTEPPKKNSLFCLLTTQGDVAVKEASLKDEAQDAG